MEEEMIFGDSTIDSTIDNSGLDAIQEMTGSFEQTSIESSTVDDYNTINTSTVDEPDDDNEVGSADCRSECKYTTGESYNYANWGYSH